MQFKTLLALGLLGSASAAPAVEAIIYPRQVSVITGALGPIKTSLQALDAAIQSFSGDVAGLTAKSKAVEQALNDGLTKVQGATAVSITEALQVQSASQELTTLTQTTVNDLIAKKDVIVKINQQKAVVDNLTAQKKASDAFIGAVVGKVPSAVSGVASALTKSIGDALQKGITAYS